jgi:hypothetical protein
MFAAGAAELSEEGNESTAGVVTLSVVDRICGNCGSSCRTTPRTVTIESEFGAGTKVMVELSRETATSLGLVAPSTIRPLSARTPIVSVSPKTVAVSQAAVGRTFTPGGSVSVTISPRIGAWFDSVAPSRLVSAPVSTVSFSVPVMSKSSDSS